MRESSRRGCAHRRAGPWSRHCRGRAAASPREPTRGEAARSPGGRDRPIDGTRGGRGARGCTRWPGSRTPPVDRGGGRSRSRVRPRRSGGTSPRPKRSTVPQRSSKSRLSVKTPFSVAEATAVSGATSADRMDEQHPAQVTKEGEVRDGCVVGSKARRRPARLRGRSRSIQLPSPKYTPCTATSPKPARRKRRSRPMEVWKNCFSPHGANGGNPQREPVQDGKAVEIEEGGGRGKTDATRLRDAAHLAEARVDARR